MLFDQIVLFQLSRKHVDARVC